MASDNVIEVIARYVQENEEALKQFREDLVGLGDDTEQVNEKTNENTENTTRQSASFTELKSAVGLVQEGYQLLNTVYDETIAKTLEQGNVIRELRDVTGGSAEEISRAVQVLDDYKISSDSLLTSQKFLAKQGLSLNVETLAKLSDEYLKLESVQERSKFLTDNLGKTGLAYAEVLSKGSSALREQGAAVQAGLIFNDKQLAQMRELEIHQDNVGDNWTAIKNNISMALLPAIDDLTTGFLDGTRAQEILNEQGLQGLPIYDKRYQAALKQAQAEREAADAAMVESASLGDLTDSEAELAAATEAANKANTDMLGLMGNIAAENKNYIASQEQVKQKQDEVKAKIDELIAQGWSPLSDKVKDLQADYDNLGLKYDENAAKHQEAMNKILYDLEIAKLSVGGLNNEEMILAQQAGLAFGQLDQNSIDTAKNFDLVAQAVADGKIKVEDMARAINMLPNAKSIDVVINALVHTASDFNVGHEQGQGMQGGYAAGGISTGPASGHMELLHGTEAVIPLQNGSIPVALMGNNGQTGGGNIIQVVLQINTPIALFDQQQGKEALLDYVEYGVKALQERGVI